MYKAYKISNLSMEDCEYSERKEAEQYAERIKSKKISQMKDFFEKNYRETFYVDTLDAEKISEIFFPRGDQYHVFISHSHNDIRYADYISYMLHEKGINAFVDSHVWENMNDLLLEIDESHCKKREGTYYYDKRNISTSHVHMILFSALINMINTCECFFFLDTQNSIQETAQTASTFSPWIMGELLVSSVIKPICPRTSLSEARAGMEGFSQDSMPSFEYPAKIKHLKNLSFCDFKNWCTKTRFMTPEGALDDLYKKY